MPVKIFNVGDVFGGSGRQRVAQNTSNAGNTTLYQYSYLSGRRIG